MLRQLHPAVLAAALLVPGSLSAQTAVHWKTDSMAVARQYASWFFGGQLDSVAAHFAPSDERPMTVERLQGMLASITDRAGLETEVVEEKWARRNGETQYWRTANFTSFDQPLLFRWAFNPDGQITGIGMGPASSPPPTDPPDSAH